MNRFLLSFFLLLFVSGLSAQNCGLDEARTLDNGRRDTIQLEVFEIANNDLADPAQGVCRVYLNILHSIIGDLEIWLRSPAGQEVQLVGPNAATPLTFLGGRYEATFFAERLNLLPKNGQWNNNGQNPNLANLIGGEFFPFQGRLDDFDTGPVNGTWELITFTDSFNALIPGLLRAVKIEFCDPLGENCCFAVAGSLENNGDVSACEGEESLTFAAPPVYLDTLQPADTNLYAYTYLLGRNDTLIATQDSIDLRTFPAGEYTLCGLSYLKTDATLLPAANEGVLVDTLRNNLNGFYPRFCGEITDSCMQVTIFEVPDTLFRQDTICAGDTLRIDTFKLFSTDSYTLGLQTANGCDSMVVLDLQVNPVSTDTLNQTVCLGDTVRIGAFEHFTTGFFRDTLQNQFGCDSIVNLDLTVIDPIVTTIDTVICEGFSITIDGEVYDSTGRYELTYAAASTVCDSIVIINLEVLEPRAIVTFTDTLDCETNTITLDGSTSTPVGEVTYLWEYSPGGFVVEEIGREATVDIDRAGAYFLNVRQTRNGRVCQHRVGPVRIEEDNTKPQVSIAVATDDIYTCKDPEVELDGSSSIGKDSLDFFWQPVNADGVVLSDSSQAIVRVGAPGPYEFIVRDRSNGCRDTAVINVPADTLLPTADAGRDTMLSCFNPELVLQAALPDAGRNYSYQWNSPEGNPITDNGGPRPLISRPGTYGLVVTDVNNGCVDSSRVVVTQDTLSPEIVVVPPVSLNCAIPEFRLDASASRLFADTEIRWRTEGAGNIIGASDTLQPLIDQAGTYSLVLENIGNGCSDSLAVVVQDTFSVVTASLSIAGEITCFNRTRTLDGSSSSSSPDIHYEWIDPSGQILPETENVLTVSEGGVFRLVVTDTITQCRDTARLEVEVDTLAPVAIAGMDLVLDCGQTEVTLNGEGSSGGIRFSQVWEGPRFTANPIGLQTRTDSAGTYVIEVTDLSNRCTASDTVIVSRDTIRPEARLAVDTVFLDCISGTVLLDGAASSAGAYSWRSSGILIAGANENTLTVDQTGVYSLQVEDTNRGCVDVAEVVVQTVDCSLAIDLSWADSIITCTDPVVSHEILAELERLEADSGYAPLLLEVISQDAICHNFEEVNQSGVPLEIRCPGTYGLVLLYTATAQQDTLTFTIAEDRIAPLTDAGPNDRLSCEQTEVTLNGTASEQAPEFTYLWTNFAGDTISTALQHEVFVGGQYIFRVTNPENGCFGEDEVTIEQDAALPTIRFGTALFPCAQDTFTFRAVIEPANRDYRFQWTGPAIGANADSLNVMVTAAGDYALRVVDAANDCIVDRIVTIQDQDCEPCIDLTIPDTLTCATSSVTLQASFCDMCENCSIQWTTNEGQIVSGASSLSPEVSEAGSYRIEVVNELGLRTVDSVTVVAVQDAPQFDLSIPNPTLSCRDTVLTVFNRAHQNDYLYRWTTPAATIVSGQDTILLTEYGRYEVRIENDFSACVLDTFLVVEADTLSPIAMAGTDQQIDCDNALLRLDAGTSDQGNGFQLSWTASNGGFIVAGAQSNNPLVNSAGTYTLQVERLSNGCTSTDELQVSADTDLPPVPVFDDQQLDCQQSEVVLSVDNPIPEFDYQWVVLQPANNDTLATASGADFSSSIPGLYQLNVTNTQTNCTNSTGFIVRLDTIPPQVDAGSMDTLNCTDNSLLLTGTAQTQGAATYQWSADQGQNIENADLEIATVFNAGLYQLEVTDGSNGCTATDTVRIVSDVARPQIQADDVILDCGEESTLLSANVSSTSGQFLYRWSSTDGLILSGGDGPTPNVSGLGVYQLEVEDRVSDCVASTLVRVALTDEFPAAAITGADTLILDCRATELTIDASTSVSTTGNNITYEWLPLSGTPFAGQQTNSTVQVQEAGSLQLIVTDSGNSCRDSLAITIVDQQQLTPVRLEQEGILGCTGTSVVLRAQLETSSPDYRFTWSVDGQLLSATADSLEVSVPGVYAVDVVNDATGCISTASLNLTADTGQPQFSLPARVELDCQTGVVALEPQDLSPSEDLRFSWRLAGQPMGSQAVLNVSDAGVYELLVEITTTGCSRSQSVVVEEIAAAIDSVEVNVQQAGCLTPTGSISVESVSGGTSPFLYQLAGQGNLSAQQNYPNLAAGTYLLRVEDAAGCTWEQDIEIRPAEDLQIDLGPDQEISKGDSIEFTVDTNKPGMALQLRWNSDVLALDSAGLRVQVRPEVTSVYTVRAQDELGCTAEDAVTVFVLDETPVYAPNAFSPDGDGINDMFYLYGSEKVQEISYLHIFNRWGTMVFSQKNGMPNNPTQGWDGTHQGQELNAAVFIYVAEIVLTDGSRIQIQGEVALLR